MAIDSSRVLWSARPSAGATDGCGVYSCPLTGCVGTPVPFFSEPYGSIATLASDGTTAYFFTENGNLVSCPISGCGAPTTLTQFAGFVYQGTVIIDGDRLVWADSNGGIKTCPKTGCLNGPTILSAQTKPVNFTGFADRFYWSRSDGSILACPRADCSGPTNVAHGQVDGLAVNSFGLYWTEGTDDSIRLQPFDGSPPVMIAQRQNRATTVAANETSVFWANKLSNGSILRAPAAGGATAVVGSAVAPFAIRLDDSFVYWASSDSIKRVPK
jgi:hypothetical protein